MNTSRLIFDAAIVARSRSRFYFSQRSSQRRNEFFQRCVEVLYTRQRWVQRVSQRCKLQENLPSVRAPLGPGSITGRTNTQGLKITEQNVLPLILICTEWLDFLVFSDKDEKPYAPSHSTLLS